MSRHLGNNGRRSDADAQLALPTWGIANQSGLWPVTIRILFVIDGRILLNKSDFEFGLGYVLDTLRELWSWWVGFEVDIASREESISLEALGGNSVRYLNFRFTFPDFDIEHYDQIWFFGDQPNETDGGDGTTDAHILPPYTLEDEEARLIAAWMDRGGGVFATGDHGVLGAALCSRIPRVRTMRRWKWSQGVPSVEGPTRHQTLQGGGDYEGEGDVLLQPVDLVTTLTSHRFPFFHLARPHPVMCSIWGPIDRFPDHMHEGDLIPDHLVELGRPLEIPGHDRPEYPTAIPEVLAAGLSDVGLLGQPPRPQIIAFGHTTNSRFPDEVALFGPGGPGSLALHKRFGLVSVYDGNPANVGRVVTDSTWHHWLSYNLAGIAIGDPSAYRKIQAYYRNIALWLASRTHRTSMLASAVWGVLIGSGPGFFTSQQDSWDMGDRAVSVMANTMSPCWLDEVVASIVDLRPATLGAGSLRGGSKPDWKSLPPELVNRAVIGSMCKSLFDLAFEHRRALRLRDYVSVDKERVEALAQRGASRSVRLLRETLDNASETFSELRNRLDKKNDYSAS